jgi:hypothetical protein
LTGKELDLQLTSLERITQLRKDIETIQEILKTKDTISYPLYDLTSEIIQGILSDYTPEVIDTFIAAIRSGKIVIDGLSEDHDPL